MATARKRATGVAARAGGAARGAKTRAKAPGARPTARAQAVEPLPPLTFRPATPERWPDLEALFGETGACAGCWCQWWKQTNAEYRAGKYQANKAALRRSVAAGEVPGLLAYAGREPVGWVAVEPRAHFKRLASSRNLVAVDDAPVWSAPCFFVRRSWRGRGLTGALLGAAAAHARRQGAPILEGYPIDTNRPLAGPWLYPGPFSTFVKAGFVEVARKARTRPVVRLVLGTARRRAPTSA